MFFIFLNYLDILNQNNFFKIKIHIIFLYFQAKIILKNNYYPTPNHALNQQD
jgi:hypothetical protein